MAVFEVSFADGRPSERVTADRIEQQGAFVALLRMRLVVNRPREVVVLRVPVGDVGAIRPVA